MMEFIKNSIIPFILSMGFYFIFLGLYKMFDFPKWLIKEKLKIKSELLIFLLIILIPLAISILLYFIYEKIFGRVTSNIFIDSLALGLLWSMAFNFKNYKQKYWEVNICKIIVKV